MGHCGSNALSISISSTTKYESTYLTTCRRLVLIPVLNTAVSDPSAKLRAAKSESTTTHLTTLTNIVGGKEGLEGFGLLLFSLE